VIVSHTRI